MLGFSPRALSLPAPSAGFRACPVPSMADIVPYVRRSNAGEDQTARMASTAARLAVARAARLLGEPRVSAAPELPQRTVCPGCRGALQWGAAEIECRRCSRRFPIVDGIPALLLREDDVEDAGGTKWAQARFFDQEPEAFELSRPHATTGLYQWTLGYKFERSVRGIEDMLGGSTVLSVCGGSGLDAEYLARAGARVVVVDVSSGAVRRAVSRGRRARLPITGLVADAERLPFADHSVDIAYVHDGLHHLDRPRIALAEMARVAERGISVSEPAAAGATRIAVSLGLAEREEEAGNEIHRFDVSEIETSLRASGFEVVGADRYALLYRHHPGRLSRLLSGRLALPVTRAMLLGFNRYFGAVGNKLSVRARRVARGSTAG